MKPIHKLLLAGLALAATPAHAATVTWGSWNAVTDNTAITVLSGYIVEGVNLNGPTTTINNGTTDVSFQGTTASGEDPINVTSASAAGITVAASGFDFESTGNNSNVVSAVGSPQTWATVLDLVIGDFESGATPTFTLSGLIPGDEYYVQFFSSTPDANINQTTVISSGGVDSAAFGSHTGGETRSIIASFTADGTSQTFTLAGPEPTFSALVIGAEAIPEPSAALLGALGLLGLLRRRRN